MLHGHGEIIHRPVMAREVIEHLKAGPGKIIVDATIGGGGHAEEILKEITPGGRLIGVDCDEFAIEVARQRLRDFANSLFLIRENFGKMDAILKRAAVDRIDGALFDIGVSSFQLDDPARGFGIKADSPLDMRMDTRRTLTAYDVVNRFRERELADVLYRFGEERRSRRIARAIAEARERGAIKTTGELAGLIARCVGPRRGSKIHPATRSFQAIRIVVNDELGSLEAAIKEVVGHLNPGSRLCVISFHSLEDRVVKELFRDFSRKGVLNVITKKPVRPSREEVLANPRSRSARLRVSERT